MTKSSNVQDLSKKLAVACGEGHTDIVAQLLQHPNAKDIYAEALERACKRNNKEIVALLLQHPTRIDALLLGRGIIKACEYGKTDIVVQLLEYPNIDQAFTPYYIH